MSVVRPVYKDISGIGGMKPADDDDKIIGGDAVAVKGSVDCIEDLIGKSRKFEDGDAFN